MWSSTPWTQPAIPKATFLPPPLLPFPSNKMAVISDEAEPLVTFQAIVQSAVILLIAIAVIVSNLLVLVTFFMSTPTSSSSSAITSPCSSPHDVMTYYLLSLVVADLLVGILVVPVSVYPAMLQRWVYGDAICLLEGYLEVTLWTVTVYTLMWIGVDRYLAIRKPLRYEAMQTKTRCQCWMLFSWITAALLCSPPLLGFSQPKFSSTSYICMLDWNVMIPYSITLIIMVLGPSIITICYTYTYVFNMIRKSFKPFTFFAKSAKCVEHTDKGELQVHSAAGVDVAANSYHLMSFTLVVIFWASWLPIIGIHIYEHGIGKEMDAPILKFAFTWLGILNSFWKTLVYIFMSPHFRCSVRTMCSNFCCKVKSRHELSFK